MPKLNCVLRLPLLGLVLSLTVGIGVVNVQRVHGQTQPVPLVEGWSIELVAKEPQLVTPVGCRFDSSGNLYVVECHTHFPPDNYPGPKHDRIYRFRDADGNGSLETQEIYYEGGRATMGLAVGRDGWLYVATRSEVARIRDQDQDGKAEQREVLVRLETTADYPHNGLSAIVFGPDGSLFVGQGENFGQPYQLIGADGSVVRGGGEGGNVFRCTADGGKLERWATGFWNPFGLAFDSAGRMWTVENDPDARPPCRLLQVIRGGDYGFQFRFGRAGTHPLLAWNGELPGTLPMTAGTGEAPCAVMAYQDQILVTSWGDNRIEGFRLKPQGATWTSKLETIVQGDVNFRPVDMAIAPDGSIYFTDWVDRSYPVHGKGRLWRLVPKSLKPHPHDSLPAETPQALAANKLLDGTKRTVAEIWPGVASPDPFMVQSAVTALTDSIADAEALTKLDVTSREPDRQAAVLRAIRWLEMTRGGVSPELREDLIRKSLTSGHPEVRRLAVRWAAEAGLKSLAGDVRKMLERTDLTTTEFAEIVAAISFIESGSASPKARDPGRETLLTELVTSSNLSPTVRALALRSLPTEATASMEADLLKWFQETSDRGFRREIVTCLAISKRDSALEALAKLLDQAPRGQRDLDLEVRGDLLAALAPAKDKYKDLLQRFANDAQQPALAEEAKRSLASGSKYDDTPSLEDVRGWWKLIGMGGDASRGRRVFMRSQCVNCHAYHGRGSTLGPELSTLHATTPRQRIFESVLMPSREIAPLFATWKILTVDGRVLTGAKLNGGGVGTNLKYLAADGTTFELPLADIENQELSSVSIMPADLMKTLTVEEIRDLLAFLE